MATFQERLKELRKAHKLKQAELAEKLGVSMFTVSVWERGQRMPEFDNLEALSSVLDVNIAYLLGASDDRVPKECPVMRISRNGKRKTRWRISAWLSNG